MKLVSFRIRNFRSILDSGTVNVREDVTCLVGKNESGKSALLEALYLLNPVYSESFTVDEQYPKWLLARDRRSDDLSEVEPIQATFMLDEPMGLEIAEVFGSSEIASSATLTAFRSYGNVLRVELDLDDAEAVKAAIDKVGGDVALAKQVVSAGDLGGLAAAVNREVQEAGGEVPQKIEKLRTLLGALDEVVETAKESLPRFFLFADYTTMPGVIPLSELYRSAAASDIPGQGGLQAARALLRLAATDAESLSEDDYESRRSELDAVQIDLTRQVFEYWKHNDSLRILIDVHTPDSTEERSLRIRVEDTRTGYSNPLDQRSAGFRWFVSFLAAFSEFEHESDETVVLLDEPGMSLHGKAQADHLRFVDERLASQHQVIYTTHSPFMVRMDALERVRLVEDRGPDEWSVVATDALARDPDSLFPLHAALGYDIAQHLWIGPDNLLVEGASDFTYLIVMSDVLGQLGRVELDARWRVTPAGSAANIPTFVALIGPHLDITVLADSGKTGMQRLEAMCDNGSLDPDRLILIGHVLQRKRADIEDVFSVEDYLNLYNGAMGASFALADLAEGDRIVDRIERSASGGGFNHRLPSDFLLRNRTEITFSEESLDSFEALIVAINASLRSE